MYPVDAQDKVVPLEGLPQCSVGAPLPLVMGGELTLLVAYLLEERDPTWDGTISRIVDPQSDEDLVVIVRFLGHCAMMFGPPNDEAFSGHPLAARGLTPYGAFVIEGSSWIRQLEQMNRVHPYHRPERYSELRHFVLSFHDSTFECVARTVEVVETLRGSMNEAAKKLAKLMATR